MPVSNINKQIQTLLEPMLKMKLYAAISTAVKPQDEIIPHIVEHLEYMIQLEKDGILFASGPFIESKVVVGSGLTILRAASLEQAKIFMLEEPLIKKGLRNFEIWEWEMREGSLNIKLDFATGKYQFT